LSSSALQFHLLIASELRKLNTLSAKLISKVGEAETPYLWLGFASLLLAYSVESGADLAFG
jgi:hypothetical protein